MPRVRESASVSDTLVEMTHKGLGIAAVVDAGNRLLGVFTDGDLRRTLDDAQMELRSTPVTSVMTPRPKTIAPNKLAVEAARMMEDHKIHALVVVDENEIVVGALNIHDLLRARVV